MKKKKRGRPFGSKNKPKMKTAKPKSAKRRYRQEAEYKVWLPNIGEEFDAIVATLMEHYGFTDPDRVGAILANRIQHLPVDQSTTTLEYLGGCVRKSIAYDLARLKAQEIGHKLEVGQLVAMLKANPNDDEPRNHLQMAADAGSKLAKQALKELFPQENSDNLVAIDKPEPIDASA